MQREYVVGQHIKFVNPEREVQDALVTIWWHDQKQYLGPDGQIGCNLVVCSTDERKDDSYGRQTEHHTSVVHKSAQPAAGNYWCWPDEL